MRLTVQWLRLLFVLLAVFLVLGYSKRVYNAMLSIEPRPREGADEVGALSRQLKWVDIVDRPSGFTAYSLEQNILQDRATKDNHYYSRHDPLQNFGPQVWRRALQKARLPL